MQEQINEALPPMDSVLCEHLRWLDDRFQAGYGPNELQPDLRKLRSELFRTLYTHMHELLDAWEEQASSRNFVPDGKRLAELERFELNARRVFDHEPTISSRPFEGDLHVSLIYGPGVDREQIMTAIETLVGITQEKPNGNNPGGDVAAEAATQRGTSDAVSRASS